MKVEWGQAVITYDYEGGGVKKCQKIDFVICERPLILRYCNT